MIIPTASLEPVTLAFQSPLSALRVTRIYNELFTASAMQSSNPINLARTLVKNLFVVIAESDMYIHALIDECLWTMRSSITLRR